MSDVTEDSFRAMCRSHDLTFEYSDSHAVWTKGREQLDKIKTASKELPREVAVRIWNEVVDSKIGEDYRSQFHWKQ